MTRSVEIGTLAFWAVASLSYYLLVLLTVNLGGHLWLTLESEALRAG